LPRTVEDEGGESINLIRRERWRIKTGEILETDRLHKLIIGLTLVDATIVITDLSYVFLNQTCDMRGDPELPLWLEILAHISLTITALFLIEIPLALWAFSWTYYWPLSYDYPHPGFHLLDAVVIIGSFAIEVGLKGKDRELASLFIIFRMWRIVKVVGGVAVGVNEYNETADKELRESRKEIEKLKNRITELEAENETLKDRAHS